MPFTEKRLASPALVSRGCMAFVTCRLHASQADEVRLDEPVVGKPSTVKRTPSVEQAAAMEGVVRRCPERSHAALQERKAAWEQRGVRRTAAGQRAQCSRAGPQSGAAGLARPPLPGGACRTSFDPAG